jgi:hypothetical protein
MERLVIGLAICHQPRIAPNDMGALLRTQPSVTTEISALTIIHFQCGWEVGCPHRLGEWSMILRARQSAAAIVT